MTDIDILCAEQSEEDYDKSFIDEKYQNGKIYIMKCNKTGLCYIGSTIEKLNKRLGKHLTDFRGYMGINNVKKRKHIMYIDCMM